MKLFTVLKILVAAWLIYYIFGCAQIVIKENPPVVFVRVDETHCWVIKPVMINFPNRYVVLWNSTPAICTDSVYSDSSIVRHYNHMVLGYEIAYYRGTFVLPFSIDLIEPADVLQFDKY